MTARLLATRSLTDASGPSWTTILRSCGAYEAYLRTYRGMPSAANAAEFLLLDRQFPRSVLFCVDRARACLHNISGTPAGTFRTPPEQVLGQLHARLCYTRAEDVLLGGLHEFIDELQLQLNAAGQGISDTFFAQKPLPEPAPDPAAAQQ